MFQALGQTGTGHPLSARLRAEVSENKTLINEEEGPAHIPLRASGASSLLPTYTQGSHCLKTSLPQRESDRTSTARLSPAGGVGGCGPLLEKGGHRG